MKTNKPLGFPQSDSIPPQGQYYCSVGAQNAFGREILEEQLEYCLYSNINITSINAEVVRGQWEYQIFGKGMDGPDDAWVSRYILDRLCEKHNVKAEFNPKPFYGNCNGSGCHCNYSTNETRNKKNGIKNIHDMMIKLDKRHMIHVANYGVGNENRLTGFHETSSMKKFTYGVATRNTSIRIPNETDKN